MSVRIACGKPKLLEDALEDGDGVDFLGGRQRLTAQQVATGKVADGERIAIAFVSEHELAFVIGAPQIVGPNGLGQGRALRLVASFAAVADQAMAIEKARRASFGLRSLVLGARFKYD